MKDVKDEFWALFYRHPGLEPHVSGPHPSYERASTVLAAHVKHGSANCYGIIEKRMVQK